MRLNVENIENLREEETAKYLALVRKLEESEVKGKMKYKLEFLDGITTKENFGYSILTRVFKSKFVRTNKIFL